MLRIKGKVASSTCLKMEEVSSIDSKFNYLTKINYRVRARSGRPKDDAGYR
jgi:hypothetical protein